MIAFPKPTASQDRIDRKRQRERDLRSAIAATWERDASKCRACHRRVMRAAGAGIRGHVHHLIKRSQSKADRANIDAMVLLCALCHADVHGYRLIVSGWSSKRATFTRVQS